MSHLLRVEHRGTYLFVTVTGENTPQDVREYLSEVREACLARGCPRVLIEENLRGPGLGTTDIYDIVAQGSESAAPAVSKLAFLDVNPRHVAADMKFAETLAVNRLLNVRFFADRHEAERWVST
jgi:hypothetical protein